jgi:hypothetical protein
MVLVDGDVVYDVLFGWVVGGGWFWFVLREKEIMGWGEPVDGAWWSPLFVWLGQVFIELDGSKLRGRNQSGIPSQRHRMPLRKIWANAHSKKNWANAPRTP